MFCQKMFSLFIGCGVGWLIVFVCDGMCEKNTNIFLYYTDGAKITKFIESLKARLIIQTNLKKNSTSRSRKTKAAESGSSGSSRWSASA